MKTHRELRVGSLIREELGKLLLREVDFGKSIVTITEVEVDGKMVWADIYVSVIPSEQAPVALQSLSRATHHLHHLLNKKLNIRPMPMIRFKIDRGPEKAAEVEKLLREGNNT